MCKFTDLNHLVVGVALGKGTCG